MGITSLKTDDNKSYLAFFDLDDTLIKVNSGKILVQEAYRQGWMKKRDIARSVLFLMMYKLKLAHSKRLVDRMTSWLKGIKESDFIGLVDEIIDKHLLINLNKIITDEVQNHKQNNARVVLLSAAVNYVCEPIAAKLDFDDVICSRLQVENGRFTGQPEGKLLLGSEKRSSLKKYCSEKGFNLESAYCYADSYSDLAVMEVVGNPVAVNHDRRLGREARRRGWRIIN